MSSKDTKQSTLPRILTPLETWSFGLTGHFPWMLGLPFVFSLLGSSSIYVWPPLLFVAMLSCFQIRRIASQHTDVAGGVPSYVYRLFPNQPWIARYSASAYVMSFLAAFVWLGYIFIDLINTVFIIYFDSIYYFPILLIFSLIGFVLAFSSTRILSIFQMVFAWPVIIVMLFFGIYGFFWLLFSPQSPGFFPSTLPTFEFVPWVVTSSFVFVNILNFETESFVVADSTEPLKTLSFLPRSAWIGAPLYLLGAWVLMRIGQPNYNVEYGIMDSAFQTLLGRSGSFLYFFTVLFSIILTYTSSVIMIPRILFQMSKDKLISPVFSKINSNGILINALLFCMLLSVFFVFVGGVEELYISLGVAWMISYICINFGIWFNRQNKTKNIFPHISLIVGIFQVFVMILGGVLSDWRYFLLGLGIPIILIGLDYILQRISLPSIQFRLPKFLSIHDIEYNQVFTTLIIVGVSVISFNSILYITTDLNQDLIIYFSILLFSVISFFSLAISSWTSLPQVQSINNSKNQLTKMNKLLDFENKKLTKLELKLQKNVRTDALTKSHNRFSLDEIVSTHLDRSKKRSTFNYALVFIDLDRFKLINDSLGHSVGDDLLKFSVHKIKEIVKRKGKVGRFGGDEFMIFLPNVTSTIEVINLCETLISEFRKPIEIKKNSLTTTLSIGVVFGDEKYDNFNSLIQNADLALYESKKKGRDRYTVFTDLIYEKNLEEHKTETIIRKAVKEKSIEIHYQPIIDVKNDVVIGLEALGRIKDGKKILYPNKFIELAEDIGLITPFTFLVIEQVFKDYNELSKNHNNIYISINLSERVLGQNNLKDSITKLIQKYGVDPTCIQFEILESVVMLDLAVVRKNISLLYTMGFKIAIDDFGVGYSNLGRLKELTIHTVKIDKIFVEKIDKYGLEFIQLMYNITDILGAKAVFEGVETKKQLMKLQQIQCQYIQGFYLAKPAIFSKAMEIINRYNNQTISKR